MNKPIFRVADEISPNLMFRGIADAFFDRIEQLQSHDIILDFEHVESISRSFAHQYIQRRTASSKHVEEINLGTNISRMIRLVERQVETKSHFVSPTMKQSRVIVV